MKTALGMFVCLVGGATLAAPLSARSVSVAQAPAVTNSDHALDERIEHRLRDDATLKKHDITVKVDAGVATLTGTVASTAEKARAGRLAAVSGISHVDNRLVVDRSAAKQGTTGKIEKTAKDGAQKTKEGAEKVADKTKDALSKTGEVITDAWITGRLNTRFVGEDLLKGSDINVDTDNHVVTLKGTVMSAAGRARAVELAKTTEGVHRVVDRLTIGPKK